jgi:hypothetical protein
MGRTSGGFWQSKMDRSFLYSTAPVANKFIVTEAPSVVIVGKPCSGVLIFEEGQELSLLVLVAYNLILQLRHLWSSWGNQV